MIDPWIALWVGLWAGLGAAVGAVALAMLARETRRLGRHGCVGTFLLRAGVRMVGVLVLCFAAFLSGPGAGLAFAAGLILSRVALIRLSARAAGA